MSSQASQRMRSVLSPAGNLAADRMQHASDIRRQLRLVVLLVPVVIGAAISSYQRMHAAPSYEAKGLMRIVTNSEGYRGVGRSRKRELNADVDLLDSEHFLQGVAAALTKSGYNLQVPGNLQTRVGKHAARDPRIKHLQNGLTITRPPDTELIQVSYKSSDPALSAAVVNIVMDRALLLDPEMELLRADAIEAYLADRLATLEQSITSQEKATNHEQFGFVPNTSANQNISSIALPGETDEEDLSLWKGKGAQAIAAETKRLAEQSSALTKTSPANPILREGQHATLRRQQAESQASIARKSAAAGVGVDVDPLQQTIDHLRNELTLLSMELGPEHPRIKALSAQIAQLQDQLAVHTKARAGLPEEALKLARSDEKSLAGVAALEMAEARRVWEEQFRASTQQIEIALQAELYSALRQRIAEQRVNAGFGMFALITVAPAQIPTEAIPKSFVDLDDLRFGLPIAILALSALLFADRKRWTVRELRAGKLEVLSILPELGDTPVHAAGKPVHPEDFLAAAPRENISEPLSYLADAVDAVGASGPKCLVVTSPAAAQGKTFLATQLAAVLAARGARVLLIDANLHEHFSHADEAVKHRPGLSNVLSGSATFAEAIQAVPVVAGLDLVAAGPASSRPYDLLASQTMRELLSTAREQYAYIVLDTPALSKNPESFVLGGFADLVLVVVRKGDLPRSEVRVSGERLRRAGAVAVGAVINRAY